MRVDRVHPRLPVGLLVLQRVDVLRPELPEDVAGGGGRGPGARSASRASSSSTTWRSSRPSTAWRSARQLERRGIQQAVLPGDPLRRAAAQQGGVPALEAARAELHVPRPRGARRGRAQEVPQARDAGDNSRRWSSPGRSALTVAINIIADPDWDEARFASSASGRMTCRRSSTSRVNTPYPGTETWLTEVAAADLARLSPVRHAARGAADAAAAGRFYEELVRTQPVLTASTWAWRRWPRPPGSWPGSCCTARPTSSGCSGSSPGLQRRPAVRRAHQAVEYLLPPPAPPVRRPAAKSCISTPRSGGGPDHVRAAARDARADHRRVERYRAATARGSPRRACGWPSRAT